MSRRQLYHLWDFISRIVGAIPPIAVAMYFFPIWVKEGYRPAASGFILIVALIATIPLVRKFKSVMAFLMDASLPVLWGIGAVISYILMNVSNELFAICIAGLVGSLFSSLIEIKANKYKDTEEKKEG